MKREKDDYGNRHGGPMAAGIGQKPVQHEESDGQCAPPRKFFPVAIERRREIAYQINDQY